MFAYIDSSVLLRTILGQKDQFSGWGEVSVAASSVLLIIECNRVLDRYRLDGSLSDIELARAKQYLGTFCKSLLVVGISEAIATRAAGAFSTPIGSLDAIHLATALKWKESLKEAVTVLSFDDQLRMAAVANGLLVAP